MSLNSKKSWHPGRALNRAKAQKRAAEELNEKVQIEKQHEALREERSLQELRGATTNGVTQKGAWIHDSANSSNTKSSDISDILYGGQIEEPAMRSSTHSQAHNTAELARKIAADPLHKILALRNSKADDYIERNDCRRKH